MASLSPSPTDHLQWLQQTQQLVAQQAWEKIDRDRLIAHLQAIAIEELEPWYRMIKKMMGYRLLRAYHTSASMDYHQPLTTIWEQLQPFLQQQGHHWIDLEKIYQELQPTLLPKIAQLPPTCPYTWENFGVWDDFNDDF